MSEQIEAGLRERRELFDRVLGAEPGRVADLAAALARRFARGGRLLAVAAGPATRADARRCVLACVEAGFPGLALVGAGVDLRDQTWDFATPADVVVAFGAGLEAEDSLTAATQRGAGTVAFAPLKGDVTITLPDVPAPLRQELATALVMAAVAELPAALEAEATREAPAAASEAPHYLYAARGPLDAVRERVGPRLAEAADAREAAARAGAEAIVAAARELAARCARGGQVLVAGEGGAAVLAMDATADLRTPPDGLPWRIRRALDLAEDPVLLTAFADAERFARQVELFGGEGDALLVFAEGAPSAGLEAGLATAAGRGLATVAVTGGATVAAAHAVPTPGPRVRETQLAVWHLLRHLLD